MDILQRDRFELLSAYLDGEVTAAERKQVQEWLKTDPTVQCLYTRLVTLRQGLQTLPVPESGQSTEQAVNQVFASINRRRFQKFAGWSGAAIAALFVGAFSGILPGNYSLSPQMAQSPIAPQPSEPLMVALNRPCHRDSQSSSSESRTLSQPTAKLCRRDTKSKLLIYILNPLIDLWSWGDETLNQFTVNLFPTPLHLTLALRREG
jgi:hypothetical protein